MTKSNMIAEYYNIICSDEVKLLADQLLELMFDDRITSGCYTLSNPHDLYHAEFFDKIASRAVKAKHYSKYISDCNYSKYDFSYHLRELKKDIERITEFVKEQTELPFEETQKQLAISKGTINYK